jgi:hypothetical protein
LLLREAAALIFIASSLALSLAAASLASSSSSLVGA